MFPDYGKYWIVLFAVFYILFIVMFFQYRLNNIVERVPVIRKGELITLDEFQNLRHLDNSIVPSCRAFFETNDEQICKKTVCQGSVTYRYVELTTQTVVVSGIMLKPGKYCVQESIPQCDPLKGIVTIDANQEFKCLCKYPNFFNGPTCSEMVACKNNYFMKKDGYLQYPNGEKVDITQDLDFNSLDIYCNCHGITEEGFRMHSLGQTACILDPCTYPLINPIESIKGLDSATMTCDCGTEGIVRNEWDLNTPCSSCYYSTSKNTFQMPAHCFNNQSLLFEVSQIYPCYDLNSETFCGTTNIRLMNAKNYINGVDNDLQKFFPP